MRVIHVRPLYSQSLDIRVGPLVLRRLSLNRHLPDRPHLETHGHSSSQFLLYLTGRGSQLIGSTVHSARPGGLFFLPPHIDHSFLETTGRRPLCLAIDLTLSGGPQDAVAASLTQSEINTVRQALSGLTRWQSPKVEVEPREAACVLQVLDVLLRATGRLPRTPARRTAPIVRRVRQAIEAAEDAPPGKIARSVGYHHDHLNRLLRESAGVSVGQIRSEIRLRRVKSLLQTTRKIGDVAFDAGFSDPNYFSRWFRRQTGLSPGAWRRQASHRDP